jgi:methionyl aminopeptidase
MIYLKSPAEIEKMKKAGRIVAIAHEEVRKAIKPGVTTKELDRICEEVILSFGATPAFKGYHGYPASICVAINDQVVHGIPDETQLRNGDIIGIDIGAEFEGYYGDSAKTWPVGEVSHNVRSLLRVTEEALYKGIHEARLGNRLSDISYAVQSHVEANGFSVVRDLVGHGIGRSMHEDPQVPNYGRPGWGPRLKEGMVLAIEPMVNIGAYDVLLLDDGWTIVTKDGSLSAHFEHTVAITPSGPLILTTLE